MSQATVTALMVTCNQERFVERAIRSALAQRGCGLELVIADDGSTDQTRSVIDGFLSDSRIRLIELPHRGIEALGETYAAALDAASGDYVAVIEGDDFWPTDKLADQVAEMEACGAALSYGGATRVDSGGTPVSTWQLPVELNDTCFDATPVLLKVNPIAAITVVCRKDALVSCGGFRQIQQTPIVDFPTWLELSRKGPFRQISRNLGFWRSHPASQSIAREIELAAACVVAVADFRRGIGDTELPSYWTGVLAEVLLTFAVVAGDMRDWQCAREGFALLDEVVATDPSSCNTSFRAKAQVARMSITARVPIPKGRAARAIRREAWARQTAEERSAMLSRVKRLVVSA